MSQQESNPNAKKAAAMAEMKKMLSGFGMQLSYFEKTVIPNLMNLAGEKMNEMKPGQKEEFEKAKEKLDSFDFKAAFSEVGKATDILNEQMKNNL